MFETINPTGTSLKLELCRTTLLIQLTWLINKSHKCKFNKPVIYTLALLTRCRLCCNAALNMQP